MQFINQFARRFGALSLVALTFGFLGCNPDDGCSHAPLGDVTVFVEDSGGLASWTFTGTLLEPPVVTESGLHRYRLRETQGAERLLVYRAPGEALPITEGVAYDFAVETVPGSPTPCGILISHGDALIFAAVSDYQNLDRVFASGVPGFTLSLEEADCSNRSEDPCFTAEVNGNLVVSFGDSTSRLYQGESVTLGDYDVTCLTARFITYSSECADAGTFEVAYTIRKR